MVCTLAVAYLSKAMPTNKSLIVIHTSFNSASHRLSVLHLTVRSLRMAWEVVMAISLSVEAKSGGLSRPRIVLQIQTSQARIVKITGRRNRMQFQRIIAITRLILKAIPISRVMAESCLRKGLNRQIGSRSWPRRP